MDVSEDTGKVLKSFLNLVRTNILQQTSIKPLFKEKIPGDNLFFVMSKSDLIQEESKIHVYYELGSILTSCFSFIQIPPSEHVYLVSVPEKSMEKSPSHLPKLLEELKERSIQAPYEKRVENAIQQMCRSLKEKVKTSWTQYISRDSSEIDEILERSLERMKNR